jgi:META domain
MKISPCRKRIYHYPPHSFLVFALACSVASALLSGCNKSERRSRSDTVKVEVGNRAEIHPLVGSRWELAGVRNFADVADKPLPRVEIKFDKARLEIVICNRIEADYALNLDAELHLVKLVTTEKYCNASTAMLESFFIGGRILYNYDRNMLTLHNGMGPMLLMKPATGKKR